MLCAPPAQTPLLSVIQISGTDHTNAWPRLSDKHDQKVSTLVGLPIGQILLVGSAENEGVMIEDCFGFVLINTMASDMVQVLFVPLELGTPHPS
jgi:hypothetical protein